MSFSVDSVKFGPDGLVPAIVQDANNFRVLMLGYMNREAIRLTLETGNVTFYSRSREEIWEKGATSGNYLRLQDMRIDCDADALLVRAQPDGPTCHTGSESCFFTPDLVPESDGAFLFKLQRLLQKRKTDMPEGSYTTSLFRKGVDKIAQKVGEEAVETVIASKNEDDSEFLYEASDLLFHLMVLLTERGFALEDLIGELEKRHHPEH